MLRQFAYIAAVLSLLAGARSARAQGGGDTSGSASPGAPAARMTLLFHGLLPSDVLRVAPTGSDLQDQPVGADGNASAEVEPGKNYTLEWGSADNPEKLRFYVPRPADPAASPAQADVTLSRGQRELPERTWSYPWAAGERDRVVTVRPARPARPPAATTSAPPVFRAEVAPPASPAPAAAAPNAAVDVAALRADLESATHGNRLLALGAMALALASLAALALFYVTAWQPHQRAMAEALERSLPNALRAQSQETAALARRVEATSRQWQQDRETLRRGQDLLASHVTGGTRDDTFQLRRDLEELRRQLAQRPDAPPAEPVAPPPPATRVELG